MMEKGNMERVFADATKKRGMRYTLYRGLAQVSNWVRLKFAAMNLKKLSRWKAKRQSSLSFLLFSARTHLFCFAACLDVSQAGRFSTGWGGRAGGKKFAPTIHDLFIAFYGKLV